MNRRIIFAAAVTFTATLLLSLAPSISFAVVDSDTPSKTEKIPRFSSNELLIRLKPSSHKQLRAVQGGRSGGNLSPQAAGLSVIDKLNQKHGVSDFKSLVPQSFRGGRMLPQSIGGVKDLDQHPLMHWYKITLPGDKHAVSKDSPEGAELLRKLKEYASSPEVESVEPNFEVHALGLPDDPFFFSTGAWQQSYPDLWGLKKIEMEAAWDQSTGANTIVVASIDTGVDRTHPDLQGNLWVNTAEIPGNGIDDDDNGYVDDYHGWNFVAKNNDPSDDHGHGSHTAGTIGAVGNNGIGLPGVNWNVKIMAVKFLAADGSGWLDGAVRALHYAADMGARVSNNSWGGSWHPAIDDAANYAHDRGMVVVAAAGNSALSALDFSPASAHGVIAVSASNHLDNLACFSNRGQKIDLAAPGGDAAGCGGVDDFVLSVKAAGGSMCTPARTIAGTPYCFVRGTSMAAPHVAGLAALLLSKNPNLTNEEIRQILRGGADDAGAPGKDDKFGFGRINATASMNLAMTHPLAPFITSPRNRKQLSGVVTISGTIPGSDFSSYKLEVSSYSRDTTYNCVGCPIMTEEQPGNWTTLMVSNTQVLDGTLGAWDTTSLPDAVAPWRYALRLTATDTSGKTYQFEIDDLSLKNAPTVEITKPVHGIMPAGLVQILATAAAVRGLVGVQFLLDGISMGPEITTPPYSLIWSSSKTIKRTYTLTALARDTAGYIGQHQIPVEVTDYMPIRIMLSPESLYGVPVVGGVVPVVSAAGSFTPDTTYWYTGAVAVQFKLDGNDLGSEMLIPNAPPNQYSMDRYSIMWDSVGTNDGTHHLRASARDLAGNIATADSYVTVLNGPLARLISPVDGQNITSNRVRFHALPNVYTASLKSIQFKIDGVNHGHLLRHPFKNWYSAPWNTKKVAQGPHRVTLVVTDIVGNVREQTVTVTVIHPRR